MAKRTHQGSIAAFLVLALLAAAPLWAQSTATLQGTVTDAQGAVVPGAQVTAVNEATAVQRTATSDSAGYYQMAALPVGSYRVETRLSGFQPKVVKDVRLEVAHTVVLNIQLSLGNVSEEVAVTAEAPVIETATTSVAARSRPRRTGSSPRRCAARAPSPSIPPAPARTPSTS
ncbi:MAG: hypothetical protein DMF78_00395 [Acidobacteria bacterium]|nr:MAG: hypothetical protein DMF78_00395 [Acidobacteriota bacterium]